MYSSVQGTFTPITVDYAHNNHPHEESQETIISRFTNKDSKAQRSNFLPNRLGNGSVMGFKPRSVSLGSCCCPKVIWWLFLLPDMAKALSLLPYVTYIIQELNTWKYSSSPFYFLISARTVLFKSKGCICANTTWKITSPDVHIPMSVVASKHWVALVIRDIFQQCWLKCP